MNLRADLPFESLDIALLALMVSEDLQQRSLLIEGASALASLREAIAPLVTASNDAERLEEFRQAFFGTLGFHGNWQQFFIFENCLLERVISRRSGIPVTLGILLLHLAEWLAIPAEGICFPGHFMVRLGKGAAARILDPFSGEFFDRERLSLFLRGSLGNGASLQEQHLKAASKQEILSRLLNVSKGVAVQQGQDLLALRCSELLLVLHPEDAYEVRDRGLLYEQLQCESLAAEDLNYFIEQCPHDPVTELLREQVARLDSRVPTLH